MSAPAGSDVDSFVVVTNRDVYALLQDVSRKLDPLPASVLDHETRIRALERKVWAAAGAAGLAGTLAGKLLPFLA